MKTCAAAEHQHAAGVFRIGDVAHFHRRGGFASGHRFESRGGKFLGVARPAAARDVDQVAQAALGGEEVARFAPVMEFE
jgi:hypothetical protein